MSFEKTNIKVLRWNENFVVLPNSFAQDHTLSHQTRSALLDTFSRSEDWETTAGGLMAVNGLSRDVARRVLNEAEASGYAFRKQVRIGGRFAGEQWILSPDKEAISRLKLEHDENTPETEKPAAAKTGAGSPEPEKPGPIKHQQQNKDFNEKKDEEITPLPPKGEAERAEFDLSEQEAQPSQTKRKRQKLPLTALPEDWQLSEKLLTEAVAKYGLTRRAVEFEAHEQFAPFWHGNGRSQKDWAQVWRKWIAKAASTGIKVPANYRGPQEQAAPDGSKKVRDHDTRLMVAKSYLETGYWSNGCSALWQLPKDLIAWVREKAPQIMPSGDAFASAA